MTKNKIKSMALCSLFAALICVGAFVRIPLPYLPFTLQTLFVLLAGMLLGKNYGAAAVGVYIALGLLGVPVFTEGGGLAYVLKPSFGYLIGFVVGAYLTGMIAHQKRKVTFGRYAAAGLCGLGVVYSIGFIYLYFINRLYLHSGVGLSTLLVSGIIATLPKDLLLCIASAALSNRLGAYINR